MVYVCANTYAYVYKYMLTVKCLFIIFENLHKI